MQYISEIRKIVSFIALFQENIFLLYTCCILLHIHVPKNKLREIPFTVYRTGTFNSDTNVIIEEFSTISMGLNECIKIAVQNGQVESKNLIFA